MTVKRQKIKFPVTVEICGLKDNYLGLMTIFENPDEIIYITNEKFKVKISS